MLSWMDHQCSSFEHTFVPVCSAGPKYGVRIRVSKRDDRNVDETSESTRPGS